MPEMELVAGVELGGTKSVAILARGRSIVDRMTIATEAPSDTLGALHRTLAKWRSQSGFAAIGIASFGPVRVDSGAADYGRMLCTPKPGWSNVDVVGALTRGLGVPSRLDTDVNGAALAEWRWGGSPNLRSLCYITVGTGVGGGVVEAGRPLHGALHPEIGHLRLRRAPGDTYEGACPFHGDCIEGLICGPALQRRFGRSLGEIDEDPAWPLVVHDFAQLVSAILLTTSAQQIRVGGGVGLGRVAVLERTFRQVVRDLAGYLPHISDRDARDILDAPVLGADAGPLGAIALAYAALPVSGAGV